MALVILPCDLPHWYGLQKQLTLLSTMTNAKQVAEGMLRIHNMCNTSTGLDPDEPEKSDPTLFTELERFLTDLPAEEQSHFFEKTLPAMTKRALDLKLLKPGNGFHFSLQQQADKMVYRRSFLASLLAHSFFSTFPKRTPKTHPTLQDFNFTFFFKNLDQPSQQAKLRSFLYYFDFLDEMLDDDDCVTFSRQVMSGKEWLTIEDWVDSCLPLCPLTVRHDGRLDDAEPQCLRVCFASSKLGGSVLCEATSQECIEFCTVPELICILASVEALEDNESLIIKDVYRISRISDPRRAATLEKLEKPVKVCVCCMDAENYTRLPLSQLEEDNVLRELNKALLGFRQGKISTQKPSVKPVAKVAIQRRLSPIGESFSSTPPEHNFSKEDSPPSSPNAKLDSPARRAAWLRPPSPVKQTDNQGRRGRFIVLGSSGECLPVSRSQVFLAGKRDVLLSQEIPPPDRRLSNRDSLYSSAQSDEEDDEDEVFHSARTSIDFDREEYIKDSSKSDEGYPKPNTIDLNSLSIEERRFSFAERLKEALLRGATTYSSTSDDSSYAVGISVTGSSTAEQNNIRCKRGTSTGFLLQEESLDDGFYQDSLEHELNQGNKSDNYSFTTESSDIEEMYDQFTRWINTANSNSEVKKEEVVSEFASTLLKRAFSDSYAMKDEEVDEEKKKIVLAARSFSLELAKQNPKLAAQLVSLLSEKDASVRSMLPNKDGQRPVATGNWGCGANHGGDAQIKLTVQWLAASYTGLPNLVYYTCRHHKLVKLDTVRRILIDRGWTVGKLTTSLLQYAQMSLHDAQSTSTLFDLLISSVHS